MTVVANYPLLNIPKEPGKTPYTCAAPATAAAAAAALDTEPFDIAVLVSDEASQISRAGAGSSRAAVAQERTVHMRAGVRAAGASLSSGAATTCQPTSGTDACWPAMLLLNTPFGRSSPCDKRSEVGVADLMATMEVKSVLGMGKQQEPQVVRPPSSWTSAPCTASFAECHGWSGGAASIWQSSSSSSAGAHTQSAVGDDAGGMDEMRTTVMLRNIPAELTRDMLIEMLDGMSFTGHYDLVYIPVDFSTGTGLGYAFVNMVSSRDVARIWAALDGFCAWGTDSDKVCSISWSEPNQGLAAHVERYRNSPVMHPDVPEGWKPALFVHGVRVQFPPPTKKLKAPKVRSKRAAVL